MKTKVHSLWENELLVDLESELFSIHHALNPSSGEPLFGYGPQENNYNLADKEEDLERLRTAIDEDLGVATDSEAGSEEPAAESFTAPLQYVEAFLRDDTLATDHDERFQRLACLPDLLHRRETTIGAAVLDRLNRTISSRWPAFTRYRPSHRIDHTLLVGGMLLVAEEFSIFGNLDTLGRQAFLHVIKDRFKAFILGHSPEQLQLLLSERRKMGPSLQRAGFQEFGVQGPFAPCILSIVVDFAAR